MCVCVCVQLLVCVLNLKICRKDVCLLFMGPFGYDQSRHVDDFGTKKSNIDDFVANKSSF